MRWHSHPIKENLECKEKEKERVRDLGPMVSEIFAQDPYGGEKKIDASYLRFTASHPGV